MFRLSARYSFTMLSNVNLHRFTVGYSRVQLSEKRIKNVFYIVRVFVFLKWSFALLLYIQICSLFIRQNWYLD
jgi:membrane protein insertase Oxa1/YidC/SpoIIIJ